MLQTCAGLELPRDPDAWPRLLAERACVAALGADCHSAVGAHATRTDSGFTLRAWAGAVGRLGVGCGRGPGGRPRGARAHGRRAHACGRCRGAADVTGTVYLVGAGPGDPGLLTVRATELLRTADVVMHDKLIPRERAGAGARGRGRRGRRQDRRRQAGAPGGDDRAPRRARAGGPQRGAAEGRRPLRLRPWRRGGAGLRGRGHAVRGRPGSHRGRRSAGLRRHPGDASWCVDAPSPSSPGTPGSRSEIDWPALAAFPGTLVFYMGVRQLPRIAAELIAGGRPGDQPAAIVERGTLPGQHVIRTTLAGLADAVAAAPRHHRGRRRRRAGAGVAGSGRLPACRLR